MFTPWKEAKTEVTLKCWCCLLFTPWPVRWWPAAQRNLEKAPQILVFVKLPGTCRGFLLLFGFVPTALDGPVLLTKTIARAPSILVLHMPRSQIVRQLPEGLECTAVCHFPVPASKDVERAQIYNSMVFLLLFFFFFLTKVSERNRDIQTFSCLGSV